MLFLKGMDKKLVSVKIIDLIPLTDLLISNIALQRKLL